MAKPSSDSSHHREIRNSKAHRNFEIGERLEAGIKLTGSEVKAIRCGRAQVSDSFARIDQDGIPTLYHLHIAEYAFSSDPDYQPTRPRRLLLHKREIHRLKHELEAGGLALVPLRIYFKGGLVKVELGLGRGKKLYDKRQDIKQKTELREAERVMRARNRAST